jgi:glutathione S-transferase
MQLIYAAYTCSLAPHVILREEGLPFTLVRVDRASRILEDGRRLDEVNPKGVVPILELDDGQRLTEVAVILQYLADLRPEAGLAPPPGTLARYRMLEWLNFVATEVHKAFWPIFHDGAPIEIEHARAALGRRLTWIEGQLGEREVLVGDRFGIADAYLFVTLSWTRAAGIDLNAWPKLKAYAGRIRKRPTVVAALEAEGLVKPAAA